MKKRLPASIVKEYVWCPVAAWLAANLGIQPPPTPRMIEGKEEHKNLKEILERHGYTDAKPLPPLPSKKWPLIATPDAYSPTRRELIEVKKVAKTDSRLYRIQAMLYAAIAQENGIKVDKVTLIGVEDNKKITIEVDQALHTIIEKVVNATLETINKPIPPQTPQPPQKCLNCRWRRYCPEKTI